MQYFKVSISVKHVRLIDVWKPMRDFNLRSKEKKNFTCNSKTVIIAFSVKVLKHFMGILQLF